MCEDQMRPNPAYTALEEILELAEGLQDDIAGALDDAFALMEGGDAWTGPNTATTFLEDLGYRKGDLPGLAEQLVESIRTELASTPAKIPNNYDNGPL